MDLKYQFIRQLIIILFLIPSFSFSGLAQTDFTEIDQHVRLTPDSLETDIALLSQYLVAPAKSDLEKVRSIYRWLIWNISYDHKAYRDGNRRINRSNEDILKRKEAICWGFATLFKAMCEKIGISSEIISGYGRTSSDTKPHLETPNHAWNSVKIEEQWYLLDATWDSGNLGNKGAFELKYGYNYFLTPPKYFIVNHLPADPDWQLLDCSISIEEYQLSAEEIILLAERTGCKKENGLINSENSLVDDKRLNSAVKAYKYNPTKSNQRELAHAQLDYEAYLTEIAERLQVEQKIDSLLLVQTEMIRLCEIASGLTKLYDTQLENCAYNYFNHAVALTQNLSNEVALNLVEWQHILSLFEKASLQLQQLPQNIITQNALSNCEEYIDYVKKNIKSLK